MTRPTPHRRLAAIQRLAMAYRPYGWSDGSAAVYADALADIDPDQLADAVTTWLATETTMPAIADLRRAVLEDSYAPVLSSGEAWSDVLDAVRRHGRQGTPFLPELTRDALRAVGGLAGVCMADDNELGFLAHRFERTYDTLVRRADRARLLGPIGHALPELPTAADDALEDD